MTLPLPARLRTANFLVELLDDAAVGLARELRKRTRAKPRSRGATLRPGIETPLWNALVEEIRPHLGKRGEKAMLARELGLHRSQVSKFFARGTAMPDAERALQVLLWLARRSSPK
ncbi:MAG: hypothetical protein HYV96_19815 [Opitutae bacterium]|nr:hypothetical protein [Opitutae bacterium]